MVKIAAIADGDAIQRFALDALDAIENAHGVTLFSCTNTRIRKRWLKHGAYYALNLLTVRNRMTRFVPVRSGSKRVDRQIEFASAYDGAWQVLPPHIIEELRAFDVILKFGMGLLRVPPPDILPVPILSYHHGDPDRYRGRPAGFWELAEGAPVMGQVVQVIGNKLDAGKVVAFAETKIFPWSYRRTLLEAYSHSRLIINAAVRNAISDSWLPKPSDGRNCRLPSTSTVAGLVARMTARKFTRLFYGAFQEKRWQVSIAEQHGPVLHESFPDPIAWKTLPIPRDYSFYADPFFTADPPAVLVEALRAGVGEIVRIDETGHHHPLIREPGHVSYPAVATIGGLEVIVPETASWSTPRAYVGGEFLKKLRIQGNAQVSDPTLVEREGRIYLFGNDRNLGSSVLSLWSAASLDEEFTEHPSSPIRISPKGSRMGGNLLEHGGRLVRLGQDLSGDYGNGLIVFEIEELSPKAYREHQVSRIQFSDRKGPHTLNIRGNEIIFDWYRDRFTPLAGWRRLSGAFQRRRPQATQ